MHRKSAENVEHYLVSHNDSEMHTRHNGNWNEMKLQRSRIACNAKDQATHLVAVVVCCRASPMRS